MLQQGTNLVNKFALLLHKCRFAQDSRDKPENDGSWRCWLSICYKLFNYPSPDTTVSTSPARGEVLKHLLQVIRRHRPANLDCRITSGNDSKVECVKSGNDNVERVIDHKIKNTITLKDLNVVRQYAALLEQRVQSSTRVRKAQAVNGQTKHIRNLLPQCASDATGFLSDVYKKSTRARKFLADGVQYGRSMIEMLGVLAIIAVLSVGGIAGYSKAMEKFKLNKAMDEYSYLIYGLLEHLDEIKYSTKYRDGNITPVVELANNLNLVPPTWTMRANNIDVRQKNLYEDPYNNLLAIYSKDGNLRFSFILGGLQFPDKGSLITENFSTKFCMELVNNVVKPLHSSLEFLYFYRSKGNSSTFYGDKNCSSGRKCLSDISIKEVYDNCKRCSKKEVCSVTIDF